MPRKPQQQPSRAKAQRKVKQRRAGKREAQQQIVPIPKVGLSECALNYVHTLVNPIDGPMGCIPSAIPTLSQKIRTCIRGNFYSGTTLKTGFIIADPKISVVNDSSCLIVSRPGYTFDTINNTSTANTLGVASNGPYVQAQFNGTATGFESRVVGALLRVRYVGTQLNMSGSYTALMSPDGYNFVGSTAQAISNEVAATKCNIDRQWMNVWYYPTASTDFEFVTPVFHNVNTLGNSVQGFPIAIIVSTEATDQPFEYEFWAVHEVIGRNIKGKTRSHADPVGLAAGVTVMNSKLPQTGTIEKLERNVVDKVFDYINSGITGLGRTAANLTSTAGALAPMVALALA